MIDQEKIVDDIMLDELEKKVPGCKEHINNTDSKKKRLGMLSVLGSNYNRDYFEGYRSLIEKEKVCAEYISDIVYTLRNYIGVADTQVKTHGEVMTPLWLVEKMLDTLPKHVWKNKHLKWLDPANGVGTFPSAIVKRLMEGLKEEIPDSCERYQHIVENMIYVVEIQSKNMFLYHCAFDIDNTHKLKTFYGSFLSKEFDEHMKNVWGIEKFDIVIGNPPFQESIIGNKRYKPLYNLFVDKILPITKKSVLIIPSRWMYGGFGLDSFRDKMFNSRNIVSITHTNDASTYFGNSVDVVGGVSYYSIDINYNDLPTYNGVKGNLGDYDIFVEQNNKSLLNKVISDNNLSNICKSQSYYGFPGNEGLFSRERKDDYIKVYVAKAKGLEMWVEKSLVSSDKLNGYKVFTPSANGNSPKFGNKILGKPNEVASKSYMTLLVNSESEGISLISYMNTKFCNFFLSLRKTTQNMKPDTLKWIPMVPFDREWTDSELYEYFKLTEDDIKLIEDRIR